MNRRTIPDRRRNFTDLVGYGSTAADERYGALAGLLGMGLVIAAAMLGGVS